MAGRRFRRPNLLLTVPMLFGAAAFASFLASPAPATPASFGCEVIRPGGRRLTRGGNKMTTVH